MCCRLQVRPIGVPTEVEWRQVNESSIEIRWKQVKEDEFRGPPLGYRVSKSLWSYSVKVGFVIY